MEPHMQPSLGFADPTDGQPGKSICIGDIFIDPLSREVIWRGDNIDPYLRIVAQGTAGTVITHVEDRLLETGLILYQVRTPTEHLSVRIKGT